MQAQKEMSSHAHAAKLIRQELKVAFPAVKFRVTCSSYSMGDSVSIYWDNGPTYEAVNQIVRKYQYGSFDGMQDLYEFTNNRKDIPQTKFVIAQRSITENIYQAAFDYVKTRWVWLQGCETVYSFYDDKRGHNGTPVQDIRRKLSDMDLTNGLMVEHLIRGLTRVVSEPLNIGFYKVS